jgi:hypothetical protein
VAALDLLTGLALALVSFGQYLLKARKELTP